MAFQLAQTPVAIPGSALPPVVVTYLGEKNRWRLENAYQYTDEGSVLSVPSGFLFDLASIPRPFWWAIAPFELSLAAPLIHDFLYVYKGDPPAPGVTPARLYSRTEADIVFRDIMKLESVPGWRRAIAYQAVRSFGAGAWGKVSGLS